MLSRLLDASSERQVAEARTLLADLQAQLGTIPATADDEARLRASIRQLDDFFLLVIVGEFNAGKSALINALVGTRILDEGVTPTTAQIHLVRHGPEASVQPGPDGVRIATAPLDLLRDLHIVDTPGINAILREHERLTADFVPRSDLVLFVTSADRPFAETERAFLEIIRDWGKKVVLVVNKADIFASAGELEEVLAFVREAASRQLGETPEIFAVSARLAWRAKRGEPSLWAASRFEALERYIGETLDRGDRRRGAAAGHPSRGRVPRLRAADDGDREGAARPGGARPRLLRGHPARRARVRPVEPRPGAERVRGEGRRRCAA
jgi:small GTP-binding protein